jgi:hypothetical protein
VTIGDGRPRRGPGNLPANIVGLAAAGVVVWALQDLVVSNNSCGSDCPPALVPNIVAVVAGVAVAAGLIVANAWLRPPGRLVLPGLLAAPGIGIAAAAPQLATANRLPALVLGVVLAAVPLSCWAVLAVVTSRRQRERARTRERPRPRPRPRHAVEPKRNRTAQARDVPAASRPRNAKRASDEIARLHQLRLVGTLTDEEFAARVQRIFDRVEQRDPAESTAESTGSAADRDYSPSSSRRRSASRRSSQ